MQLISFDSVTVHSQNFIAFFFKSISINTFQIITFIFSLPFSLSSCMNFCNLFSLFSNPKRKPKSCSSNFSFVSMAASSSHNVGSSVPLHLQEKDQQITLVV